jgi:hypothetical protein
MTLQVVEISRTLATSRIHRAVWNAKGQAGSTKISTEVGAAEFEEVIRPRYPCATKTAERGVPAVVGRP